MLSEINFTDSEKECYRNFADDLISHISEFHDKYTPITDYSIVVSKLSEIIRVSSLEKNLQDNSSLISCFVLNGYSYNSEKEIKVKHIVDFYKLVTSLPISKRKIVFDNIFNRLSKINIIINEIEDDDLPF